MNTLLSILRPRSLTLLLTLATLLPQLVLAQTATQPAQGDGSKDNPYQIATIENLMWFCDQVNTVDRSLCAVLTQDIDMAGQDWTPIGNYGTNGRSSYCGYFNGQGHVLRNLTISLTNEGKKVQLRVGLFSSTDAATIEHIVFDNPTIHTVGYNMVGVAVNTLLIII